MRALPIWTTSFLGVPTGRKVGELADTRAGALRELGFYLISDGDPNPYHYRVRPPSFINLTVFSKISASATLSQT